MRARTFLTAFLLASFLSACAGSGTLSDRAPLPLPVSIPSVAAQSGALEAGTLPWHVARALSSPVMVQAEARLPRGRADAGDLRAAADYAAQVNTIALDLARAYIDVLHRREQTRILEDHAARQATLAETAERLAREGSGSMADLFEAAANAARAKAMLIEGQQEQRKAEGHFSVIAGETLPAEIVAPDTLSVERDAGKAAAKVASHPRLRAADAEAADAENRFRNTEGGLFGNAERRVQAEGLVVQARAQRDLVLRTLTKEIREAHGAYLMAVDLAELASHESRAVGQALDIRMKDYVLGATDLRVVIEAERHRLAALAREASARWAKLAGGYAIAAAQGDLPSRLGVTADRVLAVAAGEA